ncbi:MAG: hypothetical protein LBC63_02130 [Holophagales bacterium]|jgi:hypothetical protein|nr:hypothetical protein [Holophagales bacterium]
MSDVAIGIIITIMVIMWMIKSGMIEKRQEKLNKTDKDKALQLPDENIDMNKNEQLPNENVGMNKNEQLFNKNADINKNKHLLGLIGSAILFVGIFAPIFAVPIVGNINSFGITITKDADSMRFGTVILLLAVISFVLTLLKKYEGLWFTGITSLFFVLYSFIRLNQASNKLKTVMVNPQWGLALLVIGAVLLIYSAAIKNKH